MSVMVANGWLEDLSFSKIIYESNNMSEKYASLNSCTKCWGSKTNARYTFSRELQRDTIIYQPQQSNKVLGLLWLRENNSWIYTGVASFDPHKYNGSQYMYRREDNSVSIKDDELHISREFGTKEHDANSDLLSH